MTKHPYPSISRLQRVLLAAVCLTATTGTSALADSITTVREGAGGAPADFSNVSSGVYILPVGTTQVIGVCCGDGDTADWFQFQGLLGGAGNYFSLTANSADGADLQITVTKIAGFQIGTASFGGVDSLTGSINGQVPPAGAFLVQIRGGDGSAYTVNLTANLAPVVPEPATLYLAGLGIAGMLAWLSRSGAQGHTISSRWAMAPRGRL